MAETGILGVPWVPLALYLGIVGAVAFAVHRRRGGTFRGPAGVPAALRRAFARGARASLTTRLLILATWLPLLGAAFFLSRWDPVWAVDPSAPGPQVAEIRSDGIWRSDAIEHATSYSSTPGEPCTFECEGPRYVYRLEPGQRFSFVTTIRNDGPFPITLLGRPATSGTGLALLRDSGLTSAEPSNLVPFVPVQLAPDSTVAVALVLSAPDCANPADEVPQHNPNEYSYRGYPFVYEVLGWRRVGYAWPHLTVSVAGCPD